MNAKTVAIIQARETSNRLPKKYALPLNGIPILALLIRRLRFCRSIDEIVIASPEGDDAIKAIAFEHRCLFFGGSPNDVLGRFCGAREMCGADTVVRLTGDNPFVDISMLERSVKRCRDDGAEYGTVIGVPVGAGVEVLSADALTRLERLAKNSKDREHVTLYLRGHTDAFRVIMYETRQYDGLMFRLTIDTEADYHFLHGVLAAEKDIVRLPTLELCRRIKATAADRAVQQDINYNQMMKGLFALPRVSIDNDG